MKIREAIYSVLEGTGISSDDFSVRKRFVYRELKIARNELIRQDLNNGNLLDGDTAQTLHCFPLERVDAAQCLDCESGIYVLRSKKPLPALVEYEGGIFLEVFLLNGVAIPKIARSDWQSQKKRRFKLPGFYGYMLVNNYVLIVDYEDIDELLIDALAFFKNPEDIGAWNRQLENCEEDSCDPIDMYEFECPGHLERRVIEIARSVVFRKLGIPLDTNNNTKQDSYVESKTQPAT